MNFSIQSVLAALLISLSLQAQATPLPCNVAMVDGSVDCTGSVSGNDKLGGDPAGYTVNILEMFGHSDWVALGRDEGTGSPGQGFGTSGMGENSGIWVIDPGYLNLFGEFMIVFKQSDSFAAFLFTDTGMLGGAWDNSALTSNSAGLSHVTLYVRGNGSMVTLAEPGTLALIGLGLLLLGLGQKVRARVRPQPGRRTPRRRS